MIPLPPLRDGRQYALHAVYTNFCHVTFTPEELVLRPEHADDAVGDAAEPAHPPRGHEFLYRYESLFGPMELDFQNVCVPASPANRPPIVPPIGETPLVALQ
jgi:hypothetical protein